MILFTILSSIIPSSSPSLWSLFVCAAQADPFNIISFTLFFFAVLHTFSTPILQKRAAKIAATQGKTPLYHLIHLLSEIELCFLIWCIPLTIAMFFYHGFSPTCCYMASRNFTEAAFVTVIMILAATRPVLHYGEKILSYLARFGGGTPSAWWITILMVGPLLGSLITEPAAITLCSLLLIKHFYSYKPSKTLCYVTLGLLFTNISVGGVLTHFAAPPVVMVAKAWGLTTPIMLQKFGWKVILGLVLGTFTYYQIFKRELQEIDQKEKNHPHIEVSNLPSLPVWLSFFHLATLLATVIFIHSPEIFLPLFGLFLFFHHLTKPYQTPLSFRSAIFVGLFFVGLVIHGSFQGWWIELALGNLDRSALMATSILLTSFNDNAAITYLASLIPNFSPDSQYILLAGAVTGGGLTIIANAPNPAGQSILQEYFPDGIEPLKLLASAAFPTITFSLLFYFL